MTASGGFFFWLFKNGIHLNHQAGQYKQRGDGDTAGAVHGSFIKHIRVGIASAARHQEHAQGNNHYANQHPHIIILAEHRRRITFTHDFKFWSCNIGKKLLAGSPDYQSSLIQIVQFHLQVFHHTAVSTKESNTHTEQDQDKEKQEEHTVVMYGFQPLNGALQYKYDNI